MNKCAKVGVLALQGDFDAHIKMLTAIPNVSATEVRTPDDLDNVDSLILPGGESTTIIKLLQRIDLDSAITERVSKGMPVFGTCAGMIVLANEVEEAPNQPTLKLLDIGVARNAFGRQIDSFETDLAIRLNNTDEMIRGVFIRAPYATRIGSNVEVLGIFNDKIVAVREKNVLAIAFHPELTDDSSMHSYFVKMINQ